ncbi:unnamed protein product, partial [Didymodactylos carnosus]
MARRCNTKKSCQNSVELKDIKCKFGALLSLSKFFSHVLHSPNDENNDEQQQKWHLVIKNEEILLNLLTTTKNRLDLQFVIPLSQLHREILISESDDSKNIILSCHVSIEVRNHPKNDCGRLFGDNDLSCRLGRCNDLLITFGNKNDADKFLNYLKSALKECSFCSSEVLVEPANHLHERETRQTPFSIANSINHYLYPYKSYKSLYSMYMLNSLGYVFEDKYRTIKELRRTMKHLAEQCDKTFYELAVIAYKCLKNNHCLDLTEIFDENKFQEMKQRERTTEGYKVARVIVTPMRIIVEPMETVIGHRLLRREDLGDKEKFLLVYFKDEYRKYLSDSSNLLSYYENSILKRGIDLCQKKYFLFGANNSQIKEKSYWFYQCESNEKIIAIQQQLGHFEKIKNLATYISRVGQWFTKTKSTG